MSITIENLSRFYKDFAMKLAMEPKNLIMRGLKTAVERNVAGTDINSATDEWVSTGWITQADAAAIAALVAARDAPAEEEEG